jgi:hypothetical protein
MSFWNLSDGQTVGSDKEFEMGGGNLEPIPDNTKLLAMIEECKWDEYENDRYINIKWRVMQPEEYGNRVLFQKVKVYGTSRDKDPVKTADKAKRMLAAIDENCGGQLKNIEAEPNDQQLMSAFAAKQMIINVLVWKFDGKTGNWINAVSPVKNVAAKPMSPQQPQRPSEYDDVPF